MKFNAKSMSTFDNIVYVKPVDAEALSDDILDQIGDQKQLFAVHDAQGEQIAVVAHREVATLLAEQNNLEAVSLH